MERDEGRQERGALAGMQRRWSQGLNPVDRHDKQEQIQGTIGTDTGKATEKTTSDGTGSADHPGEGGIGKPPGRDDPAARG